MIMNKPTLEVIDVPQSGRSAAIVVDGVLFESTGAGNHGQLYSAHKAARKLKKAWDELNTPKTPTLVHNDTAH